MMTRPAIIGAAALPVRRSLEKSIRDSATEVALDALADAGLGGREVDGLFVSPPGLSGPPGFMWSCALAHHLGLSTRAQALVECGGTTAALALKMAADAVRLGRCRVALVVAVDQRSTDAQADLEFFLKNAVVGLVGLYGPYDAVYGLGAPIPYYAMSAQRYMYEYGASVSDFAELAVTLRTHAKDNPRAEHRKPITTDDVLASRIVCPPLKLLDCSSFSSGAAAVVVVSEEVAKGCSKRAVYVTGFGEHHEPAHFAPLRSPITSFGSASQAARAAYAESGRGPADVDVAEVYGVFSATELMLYEDLGFFDKGQAPRALRDGKTSGEGRTFFNPSGGRLSLGHPAGVTPLLAAVELAEQIRGEAKGRKVDKVDIGLLHAEHGMINGSVVAILEGA
jgi:acetyl-CoA C-acetyltransferase